MRKIVILTVILYAFSSCGGIEPESGIVRPSAESDPVSSSYCGDGICDGTWGENEWWCIDCGYDPVIDGPWNGGYCGDGLCSEGETMLNCFSDCRTESYKQESPWGSGLTNPAILDPEQSPPAPPIPEYVIKESEFGIPPVVKYQIELKSLPRR